MSSDVDDRLNWLATQYVLGELSDTDRDAFELRLADDLNACEAVAAASHLQLGLRAALVESVTEVSLCRTEPVANRRTTITADGRSWSAVGTTLATIACLFFVMIFGLQLSIDRASSDSRLASRSDRVATELVSRWRTEMKFADVESDDADDEMHEGSADTAVPDWLLAGVSLEKHGAIDRQPKELQDN